MYGGQSTKFIASFNPRSPKPLQSNIEALIPGAKIKDVPDGQRQGQRQGRGQPQGTGTSPGNIEVVNDTSFPTIDRANAFYVSDNIVGVPVQTLNESEAFQKADIKYLLGIFCACTENEDDPTGGILCATHAGNELDSTKAEQEIIRKLRSAKPSIVGISPDTTAEEIIRRAVSIAMQIKYPVQESDYSKHINKFRSACNVLRGPAKEACDENGNTLSKAAASLTQAIGTLGTVGIMNGGSRKRGGIANRRKHRW